MIPDNRLNNEIIHGKYLASTGAGKSWNWESHAGKLRWKRRIDIIPFDFLHPAVPPILIKPITYLGIMTECTPLLKEIAGSVHTGG
jgi:hypothetical protein